jgi:NAD-dependent epimerase/dehydratase family protein
VPHSIADPIRTNESNVTGSLNMLVAARDRRVKRFVYAASTPSPEGARKHSPGFSQFLAWVARPAGMSPEGGARMMRRLRLISIRLGDGPIPNWLRRRMGITGAVLRLRGMTMV